MGLFRPVNLFLSLVTKKDTTTKVYFIGFAILGKPAFEYKSPFLILGEYCERYGWTDKKYNHVPIIGFVQTGIYRFSTRDISAESYINRKWQKRVIRGPLITCDML